VLASWLQSLNPMWQKTLLLGSVVALAACSGSIATEIPGEVVTPTNLKVTAAVSGLTLGDEGCASPTAAGKSSAASCAAEPAGAAPREPGSGDIAPGGCGGYCRQSGVQISFKASAEGSAAAIEITKVVLIEGADKELETLTPSNPKAWNGTGYVTWGQNIAPGAEVRSTYSLSSPAWSKNGGNYTKQYKVRITVKVGEGTTVIDSEPVSREAPVAT
jgi:hypothetical protein